MINVLGICGSPVKESNTELIMREALKSVEQDGIKIDIFTVNGKRIEDCRHCNWCMAKQDGENFCAVKDDMAELYPKVVEADALMVASPVYLARMSGHLASVLDRLRCIHYGKYYAGGMKHKVGTAIAVSWFRNSGIETTLTSIHWAFLTYQMVIAVPGSLSTFGGAGLTSLSGIGDFDPKDKHQVLKDEYGLKTARATAKSMLDLAMIIKAGKKTYKKSL
jgi:multimeric flavodoxin WrbA